jgi:hypothetical protein
MMIIARSFIKSICKRTIGIMEGTRIHHGMQIVCELTIKASGKRLSSGIHSIIGIVEGEQCTRVKGSSA